MPLDIIDIVYGATPSHSGEARYNKLVADDVGQALEEIGLKHRLIGLKSYDDREILSNKVFNLSDGDDEEDRFEIVSFAKELEGRLFTGSNANILSLAKDKTLSWAKSFSIPDYWDTCPPPSTKFLAKPRGAHGSLLITMDNVGGLESDGFSTEDFFYQKLLVGTEYTVCFLGSSFMGLCKVGGGANFIITRDDKWEESSVSNRPPRKWDLSGIQHPLVREQASRAWAELLELGHQSRSELAYGRVDVREDELGKPHIIDINPNAYLGKDGLFFSCWAAQGGTYKKLIEVISQPLLLA